MRLESVRTFKGVHVLEFDPSITVLIGKNNTGKTTVLHAAMAVVQSTLPNSPAFVTLQRSGASEASVSIIFEFKKAEAFWTSIDVPQGSDTLAPAPGNQGHNSLAGFTEFQGWGRGLPTAVRVEVAAREGDRGVRLLASNPRGDFGALEVFGKGTHFLATDGRRVHPHILNDKFRSELRDRLIPELRLQKRITAWSYRPLPGEKFWRAPPQRLGDDDDGNVRSSVRFLKMKHHDLFVQLERTLIEALPEFERIDFDETDDVYDPRLVPKLGDEPVLVERNAFGAGSWAFLAILTAAYSAKATGATTLFLDEPHLYMHPGLERRLISALTNPERWPNGPLQLVVATHSPAFVDHALRRGTLIVLDWQDDPRDGVRVHTLDSRRGPQVLRNVAASVAELVYADRLVYVEGVSDRAAVDLIVEDLALPYRPRLEPLYEPDRYLTKHVTAALDLLARSLGTGPVALPLVVLDADRKNEMVRRYGDPPRLADGWPAIVFMGKPGNDFESLFCERDFLSSYFRSRGVTRDDLEDLISAQLRALQVAKPNRTSPIKHENKGGTIVEKLHEALLPETLDRTKEEYLAHMLQHVLANRATVACKSIWDQLAELRAALQQTRR